MTLTLPGAGGTVNRGIVLPSLREGIDTSNATGRMVAGVLASLAELELVSRATIYLVVAVRGDTPD